jgi:decaprenylphospho-beta-D-erythro-pentofuranosid-2-ulose 2-reductase
LRLNEALNNMNQGLCMFDAENRLMVWNERYVNSAMTTIVAVTPTKKIIILGALSAIAEAAARIWADQGAYLLLAGRDKGRLEAKSADLRLRGGVTDICEVDLAGVDADKALTKMVEQLGGVDVILLAYGVLGDQNLAETNLAEAQRILTTNFNSAAAWCLAAANVLEAQRRGVLIVIGSVAGDRGRMSNYVYGAAKGGLGVLVQGLAHRLASTGARAVLIKPGFVDTPMTASIGNKGILWEKPQAIARIICRATESGTRLSPVMYAPWFWRWIIYVVRLMPSFIFHRTKL